MSDSVKAPLLAILLGGFIAASPGVRALDANGQLEDSTLRALDANGQLEDSTLRALDANGQLENPALQARFETIAKDLRCLVCQNESVADSNAQLAGDLRRQVREMLVAGRSDDEIFKFMTDRYGEFVRFNPPLEAKTLLIWGAPFIMLLGGVGVVCRVVRQRSRMPFDDEPSPGPL